MSETSQLTSQQLRHFGEHGFLVVENVVPRTLMLDVLNSEPAKRLSLDQGSGPRSCWIDDVEASHPILAPFFQTGALDLARSAIAPDDFEFPISVQLTRNSPPWRRPEVRPHLDGLAHRSIGERPGSFTLIAAILLTDQLSVSSGNLWVWPGSHISNAEYFTENGAASLMATRPYPPSRLAAPQPVCGRAGDLVLLHYLLGHQSGDNESSHVRYALYVRLRACGHKSRWQACIQDPFLEFSPVRQALNARAPLVV